MTTPDADSHPLNFMDYPIFIVRQTRFSSTSLCFLNSFIYIRSEIKKMEDFLCKTYQCDSRVVGLASCRSVTPSVGPSVGLSVTTQQQHQQQQHQQQQQAKLSPSSPRSPKLRGNSMEPLFASTPKRGGGGGGGVAAAATATAAAADLRSNTLPHQSNGNYESFVPVRSNERLSWASATNSRSSSRASNAIKSDSLYEKRSSLAASGSNNNNSNINNNINTSSDNNNNSFSNGLANNSTHSLSIETATYNHSIDRRNSNNNHNHSNNNINNSSNNHNVSRSRGSYPSSPTSSMSGASSFSGSGNTWLCRGCGGDMLQGEVSHAARRGKSFCKER